MASYTLSGSGTQALTAGVVALHITITTLPASAGNGGASPLDYYGVGTLRPGNAAAFWEPFTICGGPQWMPVPFATTRLGYALRGNAVVSVVEVYSPAPLVFPLALLPDVAIASPADTQVLTYQSSTAKWINAAAPSGGGGGGRALLLNWSATTDLANGLSLPATSWVDLPTTSQTFTVTASGHVCELVVGGAVYAVSAASDNVMVRAVLDSTTNMMVGAQSQAVSGTSATNMLVGQAPIPISGLSAAAHTVKLQARSRVGGSAYCRASTQAVQEFLSIVVWQN